MANKITHFLFNFANVNILPTFTTSNDSEHNHLHKNKTRIMRKIRFFYLVALLLMAAVGARADALAVTSADIGKVICTDGSIYATKNDAWYDSKTPVAMIAYVDTRNGKALAIALSDAYYYSNDQYKWQFQWAEAEDAVDAWVTENGYSVTFDNATWKVPSIEEWQQMLIGCDQQNSNITVSIPPSETLAFAGLNDKLDNVSGDAVEYSHWSATEYSQNTDWAWVAYFYSSLTYAGFWGTEKVSDYGYAVRACLAFDIEVTEHVTVYEGLRITTADIGKFICADGTIYDTWSAADNAGKEAIAMIAYVDKDNHKALGLSVAHMSYANCESWYGAKDKISSWAESLPAGQKITNQYLSWELPTIQEWQQMFIGCGATGTLIDNPSSGESTMSYSGLKTKVESGGTYFPIYDDINYYYWSATPDEDDDFAWCLKFTNGTATFYSVEKSSSLMQIAVHPCLSIVVAGEVAPEGLKVTDADIGKVVCTDGSIYATRSDADNAGKKAVAMIAYVDGKTGLAIAREDVYTPYTNFSWNDAGEAIALWVSNRSFTLEKDYLSWSLPTMKQWQQMLIGCGAAGTVSDNTTSLSFAEMDSKLQAAGLEELSVSSFRNYYWSGTESDNDNAWVLKDEDNDKVLDFSTIYKENDILIRACISFPIASTAPEAMSLEVTEADLGKVVCTDGSIYATITEATDDGKTPAGMIAYVDMELETGLAIALADETEDNSSRYLDWSTATAKAAAHQPAIEGTTWKLPTKEEWEQMLYDEYTQGYSSTTLNNQLYNAGGTSLSSGYYYNQTLYSDYYWTSTTEENDDYDNSVYYAAFSNDNAYFTQTYWNDNDYHPQGYARACFAFNVEVTKYPITVDSYYASYVQCNKTEAAEGETVGLTITNLPEGKYVEYVSVVKSDDSYTSVSTSRSYDYDNVWTFTMPAYPVVVDWVSIRDIEETKEIDGLYYTFYNQSRTAEVAPHPSNGYSGAITIPATVTYNYRTYTVTAIGREAFAGYSNNELTSVTCGSNITTIRRDAFYQTTMTSTSGDNARQLSRKKENAAQQGLIMNEGLTTIEQYAFRESNFDIEIPASVNNISRWAFKGYKGTKMSVRDGNTTYDSRDNCNAIIEKGQEFYVGGSYVPKVTIVAGCSASTFPSTVEAIGEAAFDGVGLTTVTIPSTIKILDTGAFANNPLTSIFIPKTVETIYTNPLYGCNQLQSIEVEAGNPNYDSRDNCNAIIDTQKNWLMSSSKGTVIPTSVYCISTHAFAYRDDLNEYRVPKHITLINDNAFAYSNLWNISLEDNNELSLGMWAFQGCKELRTVKIGRGIKYLAKEVFKGCPNLKSVYVNAPLVPEVKNTAVEKTFLKDDAGNLITATVYVPASSLSTYKKIAPWKNLNLQAATGLQGVKAKFGKIGSGSGSGASARGLRRAAGEGVDLITEEGTIWRATGASESAFSINANGNLTINTSNTVTLSNRSDMDFVISGPVKEIVVRAAGNISQLTCEIIDISQDADNDVADTENTATVSSGSNKYTFTFSGKEYAKAKVRLTFGIQGTANINDINIVQSGGDYVITDEESVTVTTGVEYSNTLSAPASAEDAEAIIDGDPVYVYTTCLPTAPEQSEGLKFYTLKGSTENSLQFAEIDGAPQANTPYLVAVSSTTEIEMSIDGSVTLKKETDNTNNIGAFKFVGTTTGLTNAEAAAAGAYILQDGNVWGRVTTEHFEAYIPPFRAYIVPTNANARALLRGAFISGSDVTTTISNMQLTDRDGTTHYFDLNGRRIAAPATKGVYIVNGKKVLINK